MTMLHVWGAVDKNGDEFLFNHPPIRNKGQGKFWVCDGNVAAEYSHYMQVPSGTIKFLTGKALFWEDEPVQLQEVVK